MSRTHLPGHSLRSLGLVALASAAWLVAAGTAQAQFVTQQITSDLGDWSEFNEWDDGFAREGGELKARYHDGLRIVRAAHALGGEALIHRLWTNPPATPQALLERFADEGLPLAPAERPQ